MQKQETSLDLDKKNTMLKRIASIPYLLIFVAFCLPLVMFSCGKSSDENAKEIVGFNAYEFASGIKLTKIKNEDFSKYMNAVQKLNPGALDQLTQLERPNMVLYGVFAGVLIASIFAWFTPIGSFIMGLCSLFVMWLFIMQIDTVLRSMGIENFVFIKASYGAWAATLLFAIAFATNLASAVRPILERKRQKKVKL